MLTKQCLFCQISFEDTSRGKNKLFCCTNHQGQYRWLHKKEQLLQYNKQYEKNNLQKVRQRKNEYRKEKYRSEPKFALEMKLRVRINRAIKSKKTKFLDLVGCSIEELKIYIESKFLPGMTWGNYGEWEIDHTEPLTAFDTSTLQGQQAACQYTNLRPMWAKINQTKNNKKTMYLVTGAPGAGKSWVARQLDIRRYLPLDSDVLSLNKIEHQLKCTNLIPVVFLTVGVATFIKRHPELYIQLTVIEEDEATLNSRILQRGGTITKTIKRRAKRMRALSTKAIKVGTSSEIATYFL